MGIGKQINTATKDKASIMNLNTLKRLVTISLLAAAVAACNLAGTAGASTNAVAFINIQLSFLTQGPNETNTPATNDVTSTVVNTSVGTKDVIGWLGAATTNSFSAKAKLVRVKHFNADTNTTTIEIRDGTNAPVDVSAFFANSLSTDVKHASVFHAKSGLITGRALDILILEVTNAAPYNLMPYIHVVGAGKTTYVAVKSGKTVLGADEFEADTLAGAGAGTDGVIARVTGSYRVHGTFTEVK